MREKIEPMRTRINAIPASKTGTKSAQYLYNNGVTSNSSLNSSQEPRSTNNLEFRRQVLSARPRYVAMSSRQSERQTEFKIAKTTAMMVILFILLVYPGIILIIYSFSAATKVNHAKL